MIYTTNYLAVIIAGVGAFAIGFLWFGPLFGKKWMALMNFTSADIEAGKSKGMGKQMTTAVLSNLVSAFVFLSLASSIGLFTFSEAICLAILVWLGFSAPIFLNGVLWEGKSWPLFWIGSLHILATLIFTAVIYVSMVV